MRSKGSWRRLSKTSSAELSPKLVQEVRPFFHAHEKINVTPCGGLGGRYRDQGVIVSHDALSAVPEQRISFRPDLKGSSIAIFRRPRIVKIRNHFPYDQPLVAVGRESYHATLVWRHARQDRSATITSAVGEPPTERISVRREAGAGKVSQVAVERGPVSGLGSLTRGKTDVFRGLLKHRALHTRLTIALSGS
jgi:hypothetical protein